MITRLVLLLVFAFSLAAPIAAQDNEAPEGFTALFNGKDLDGWEGAIPIHKRLAMSAEELKAAQEKANALVEKFWSVRDGAIVMDATKGDKGVVNLASKKHFKNFELMVDWKINAKGDSGLYLRGYPQVQIWDSKSVDPKRFSLEKDKGSGALWNNKNPEEKVPLAFGDREPGQWNTFHIVMKGEKVSVTLNGTKVVNEVTLENIWERGTPLVERGPIELQMHGNQEGKPDTYSFKNIYVKELP